MSEQEQAQQPMETEPTTAAPDSPMVAEPTPSPSGEGEVAKEGEQAPAQEEPKQEVLVLGLDYGTQKCVLAVTRSAEMFPAIVQNNLANQVTPYEVLLPAILPTRPDLILIIWCFFVAGMWFRSVSVEGSSVRRLRVRYVACSLQLWPSGALDVSSPSS